MNKQKRLLALLINGALLSSLCIVANATDNITVNKNALVTNTGVYNTVSYTTETGPNHLLNDRNIQNFASTVNGSLNSIESENSRNNSGVANSIVGTANRTVGTNGSTIMGAGNEIISPPAGNNFLGLPKWSSYDSAEKMSEDLRANIKKNGGGGSTTAIGSGNKAYNTVRTTMIGVKNTVTGENGNQSASSFVAGVDNIGTNVNHMTVIGSNNDISNALDTVIIGTNRGIYGGNHVVILGSKDDATEITVDDAVALGHNADVSVEGGVALGSNSNATVDKGAVGYDILTNAPSTDTSSTWKSTASAVSVGDVANDITRQITSVAAGTNDTDAVNVAQLKEVSNKTDINKARIDKNENSINDMSQRINNIQQNAISQANHYTDLQVNKGVAKASALAGLKFLDYNPKDKWSFAASVGHYRNANATAVGAAYQPNENTMIHGGIALDGEVAYNLGVSFKTGGQKQVTRHELEEQVRQLTDNNIHMQEELNEIRSMLEKNK